MTIYLRPLNGETGSIHTVKSPGCESPAFVSNELLLATGDCPYFLLLNTNGHVLAEKHLDPQHETPHGALPNKGLHVASRPALSRNGQRFAVVESRLVPGSSWRDTFPTHK